MPSALKVTSVSSGKNYAASALNRLEGGDRPAHDWYRFVLSYPPQLVRSYLERFDLGAGDLVLDPFCGTGTTVVECKRRGIGSVGVEAHPMAHFAGQTKSDWAVSPRRLRDVAGAISDDAMDTLDRQGVVDDCQPRLLRELPCAPRLRVLHEDQAKLLLRNSISPLPLHKVLVLLDAIERHATPSVRAVLRLALAKELVTSIGNLHFGPEVGVGPAKPDAAVVSAWSSRVEQIADDLEMLREHDATQSSVVHGDSRNLPRMLAARSVSAVITSPPYPNEKDYTRTTRLESVLLGFIKSKGELQTLKRGMLMRSNTRNVYKGDADDRLVADHSEIQRIANAIEARRIELGKTSGFERLYARVTRLYFGGMSRHLAELRPALRPGARLAYVVGDQASYLRVMIRTGQLLASLAERLGYVVEDIVLFRTRLATATGEQLREEVVLLRWDGR